MDYLLNIATTTLAGTLSIPEPLPPATTFSTHSHHATSTSTAYATATHTHHAGGKHGHHGHGHGHGPGGPGGNLKVQQVGKAGETALWIVFGIFTFGMIAAVLLGRRVSANLRLFHHITAVILGMAMLSYLAMATGLGSTLVPIAKHTADSSYPVLREFFYARYIDWAITTPLLLLDLALLAGLPYTTIAFLALTDEAMILTGLLSGLSDRGQGVRFLFYGISCAFFLYVVVTLVVAGRSAAKLQSDKVQKTYNFLMLWTVALWTAYPIVFALSEATGILSVNAETICYAILDVLAKFVFGAVLIVTHSHTEGDSVLLPESWVHARNSAGAGYGSLSQDE